jgi:hypothetical protein
LHLAAGGGSVSDWRNPSILSLFDCFSQLIILPRLLLAEPPVRITRGDLKVFSALDLTQGGGSL